MSLNPSARCYVDNFCGRLLYKCIDVWKGRKNKRLGMGGCHSSVDSSVPSILQPWVWFTNTKTYAFCNLCLNYVMKRTKNYKKRPRIIHKNTLRMVQNTTLNLWISFRMFATISGLIFLLISASGNDALSCSLIRSMSNSVNEYIEDNPIMIPKIVRLG